MNKKIIEEITNWGWDNQDFSYILELLKSNLDYIDVSFSSHWERNKNSKGNFIFYFQIDSSNSENNGEIIEAMLNNQSIGSYMYYQWRKPGIFYFMFEPLFHGYYKSSDFVTKNNITRQYVNNSKHKFHTLHVSPKIIYIKNK